jgi:hypothetical protein
MRLSGMKRTFTLHLYLQGNEGPVFSETFYFVSKHPAGDNLQVHNIVKLAYGSALRLLWMRELCVSDVASLLVISASTYPPLLAVFIAM